MNAPTPEAMRRGWCPGTLRPMQTGDGWLVRLYPPRGALSPEQLGLVAALARRHGNGQIELSGRGNLQLRGVREAAHPILVEALLAAGLVDEAEGDGPRRLTLLSPLAGRAADELLDAAALAAAAEREGRRVAGLPAKFCIAVDGGGALALDDFPADLSLRALAADAVAFGLPGGLWFGPAAPETAPALSARLLTGFVAANRRSLGQIRRMRDLDPAALNALAAACGLPPMPPLAARRRPEPVGIAAERDGRCAVLAGLPFGRGDADGLERLAALARRFAVEEVRLSPWRALAFCGLAPADAEALSQALAAAGLVLSPGDPRLSVFACAGAPACTRGEAPALADAAMLAQALAPLLASGRVLHLSGCVKSCAHTGAADLTLVGAAGRYDVVIAGSTRDPAIARLALPELVRRLEPGQDIRARLAGAHRIESRSEA